MCVCCKTREGMETHACLSLKHHKEQFLMVKSGFDVAHPAA